MRFYRFDSKKKYNEHVLYFLTCLKFLKKCCETFTFKIKNNICLRKVDNIVVWNSDVPLTSGENEI